MNIFQFNKVVYKGNVNRDFYLYCLKKNVKLIKYLFINIFYFLISIMFNSKKELYSKKRYKYLKEVDNLEKVIEKFYSEKNRYNSYINEKKDIIIDKIPKILIPNELAKKIIGYELDDNFEANVEKYEKEEALLHKANKLYVRNKYNLENISCKEMLVVKNNKMRFISKRKKKNMKIIKLIAIIILSAFLTCVSYCYTNYVLDIKIYISYFEPRLFLMNFLPIFLFMLLIYFISNRTHVSFLLTSIIILVFGIANQTKLLYREDIIKFEDLMILKEAVIMTGRYDIVIKKYTIISILLVLVFFFLSKRFLPKSKLNIKKQIALILCAIIVILSGYQLLYKNEEIYDELGATSLINIWIETRQYQIRGLIYPFIYTLEDGFETPPENYDEEAAIEALAQYEYEDMDEDEKVNIIAIMLEAYNDFSKFGVIDFTDDVYAEFHEIQEKSIHGNLISNVFGGSTVVTERNFLTGYYDIPSIRKNTNSYVWYFKEQGYRTEAMHPYYGSFYNRGSVNLFLGFDTFYYYENKFSNVTSSILVDSDFFDYIIEGYNEAKNDDVPYFNFSVTYQNHGPYTSEEYEGKGYFFENDGYSTEAYNIINEYFSGIKKTNEALAELIDYFENEEEPTIIIIFGDHNPYLGENALGYNEMGINVDISTTEGFANYYETPYIIYANDSAKEVFDKSFVGTGNDISPIFLMNELFDYCGLKGNEYLQYMSELKTKVDVIHKLYYKENGEFVLPENSTYLDSVNEYLNVNYYYSRNYGG